MKPTCRAFALMALTFTLIAPISSVSAMPVPPQSVPIERLTRNIQTYIKAHPNSPDALFTLGRVHYFAFAARSATVNILRMGQVENTNALPQFYTIWGNRGQGNAARGPSRPMPEAERIGHVREAIQNLWRARLLSDSEKLTRSNNAPSKESGLFDLCLACALEEGAPDAAKVGPIPGVPLKSTTDAWRREAIQRYGLAFDAAATEDAKIKTKPVFGLNTLVSYEAGASYKRLLNTHTVDAATVKRLDRITQTLSAFDKLPSGPVTPIILTLDGQRSLSDLLDFRHTVRFDLDGTGRTQAQPWLQPETALLVWDPENTGQITSGRQLFGSVTWWMFWRNGYEALAALDDNGDGWLTGQELRGLALWQDRNGNGNSDPGEVTPLAETPIVGLRTRATGRVGESYKSRDGLRLRDGRLLPTYDWVVTPVSLVPDR